MYTRICVFIFVSYCRFQADNERMNTIVKEIVTQTSNEFSNWPLLGQDRPPYLKKGLSSEFTNFPIFQKSGSHFKGLGCRRVT
jgi:hypothetical protein